MYLPFTEAKLTVMKEKEKKTRKHTATKRMKVHSVSGMTQDDFVKVIWQTETGSGKTHSTERKREEHP